MHIRKTSTFLERTHPDIKLDILVLDRLDIEADCWDRRDALVQLQLVQDG